MNRVTPVDRSSRIELLDVLRGFALFGIMFVNMTWFTGFAVMSPIEKAELGTVFTDKWVYWLIQVFVDGKFWTLFAFLFGVGIAIQYQRALNQGTSFTRLHLRRIGWLFVIGMGHAIFLWFGDIVSLYAASGLLVLLFCRQSDKRVLVWSLIFLTLPIVQLAAWLAITKIFATTQSNPGYGPTALIASFASGTWFEAFLANWEFLKERWLIALYDGRFLKLCGMFLIGWWTGRQRILEHPERHKKLLVQIVYAACLIGIPLNLIAYTMFPNVSLRPPSANGWIMESLKSVGIPLLGLGYVAAITLFHQRLGHSAFVRLFAFAGRMSLTNYIGQSLICVLIFYGYGFAGWGRFGITSAIPVIVIVFMFQMAFSYLWLTRFRQGPLEWIWRCLTYRRLLPIRVQASPNVVSQINRT